jgi:hypothetical protein
LRYIIPVPAARPLYSLPLLLSVPLVGVWLFSRNPAYVEDWAQGFSPSISRSFGSLSSLLPVSVAELLLYLLVVLVPLGVLRLWRAETSVLGFFGRCLYWLVICTELSLLGFYTSWGLNYARLPLADRLDLKLSSTTSPLELQQRGEELSRLVNLFYKKAHGTDNLGQASTAPPLETLHTTLEKAFEIIQQSQGLEATFAIARPAPKPIFAAPIMARLQLIGFYAPHTGEANFLPITPGQQLPQGLAHEKAHQRGIAPEDEANFIGFLAAAAAPNPYCQYSGYLFAFKQVYFELYQADRARAEALLSLLVPGVRMDMEEAWKFWQQYQGAVGQLSRAVNDSYLKANGLEEGIETYNRSLQLFLAWALKRGGVEVE